MWAQPFAPITCTTRHCIKEAMPSGANPVGLGARDTKVQAKFRVLVSRCVPFGASSGHLGASPYHTFYHILFSIKNTLCPPKGMSSILVWAKRSRRKPATAYACYKIPSRFFHFWKNLYYSYVGNSQNLRRNSISES